VPHCRTLLQNETTAGSRLGRREASLSLPCFVVVVVVAIAIAIESTALSRTLVFCLPLSQSLLI
jgi:hypothetical protein